MDGEMGGLLGIEIEWRRGGHGGWMEGVTMECGWGRSGHRERMEEGGLGERM